MFLIDVSLYFTFSFDNNITIIVCRQLLLIYHREYFYLCLHLLSNISEFNIIKNCFKCNDVYLILTENVNRFEVLRNTFYIQT